MTLLKEGDPSSELLTLPATPKHWDAFVAQNVPVVNNYEDILTLPTPDFLAHINNLASEVIKSPGYRDPKTDWISEDSWKKMVKGGMLAAPLAQRDPSKRIEEIMQTMRILSYHDLHLGLSAAITTALVIMTFQRFSRTDGQRDKYLNRVGAGEMFGLGVTEHKKSGSSAFEMESNYQVSGDGKTVTLNSKKHLQGLSGKSGLIIVANKEGAPVKILGMFIVDQKDINTKITKMAGLRGIPYGINTGSVVLNMDEHLMRELPRPFYGFRDMFTKSRLLFPSMVVGHQERMEEEAIKYANKREIDGVLQIGMPFPQYVLSQIRTRRIISEAIFNRVIQYRRDGSSLIDSDTTDMAIEANIIKLLPTHYALGAAAERAELMGGDGYYADSALQDYDDVYPFKIFEGTEKKLYTQIGHDYFRKLKKGLRQEFNMVDISQVELDSRSENVSTVLTSKIDHPTPVQEEIFGEIISRKYAIRCVEDSNMDPNDAKRAKALLNQEISQIAQQLIYLQD